MGLRNLLELAKVAAMKRHPNSDNAEQTLSTTARLTRLDEVSSAGVILKRLLTDAKDLDAFV
jgi:hypothetical protein